MTGLYCISGSYSPSYNMSGSMCATGIILGVQGYSGSFSYGSKATRVEPIEQKNQTRDDGYSRSASPASRPSKPSPASPATKIYKDVLVGGFGYS